METKTRTKSRTLAQGRVRPLENEAPPIYRRIEDDIRTRIQSGEWKVGAMISGRQRLSEEYDVHINTIEKAIKALVDDGTLETQGTRGTFVTDRFEARDRSVSSQFTLANVVPGKRSLDLSLGHGKRSRRIVGVVSLDEDVSFDTQNIIRSLEKTMSNAGGSVLFLPRRKADGRLASVREVVGDLVAKGAQAVAILSYNEPEVPFDDVEGLIPNAVVPTVHVSPVRADRPVWNVYYDSVDAGFQATSHLIECGCKSFAYLACEHTEWSDERLLGMQSALNRTRIGAGDLRIRFEPRDANSDPWRVDAGERAALAIFSEFVPDGIVATNDHMAHGVLIAAEKLGLKAGDDFLLVAFDDSEVAQSLGISSMRSPVEEMGANGAFLAIRALEGDTVCQKVSLNSHLIVRATTIWNLDRHNA